MIAPSGRKGVNRNEGDNYAVNSMHLIVSSSAVVRSIMCIIIISRLAWLTTFRDIRSIDYLTNINKERVNAFISQFRSTQCLRQIRGECAEISGKGRQPTMGSRVVYKILL
jgi:hypothetical protein